jgi:hypothetical protein
MDCQDGMRRYRLRVRSHSLEWSRCTEDIAREPPCFWIGWKIGVTWERIWKSWSQRDGSTKHTNLGVFYGFR